MYFQLYYPGVNQTSTTKTIITDSNDYVMEYVEKSKTYTFPQSTVMSNKTSGNNGIGIGTVNYGGGGIILVSGTQGTGSFEGGFSFDQFRLAQTTYDIFVDSQN